VEEALDVIERPFEVDGLEGRIRLIAHPSGRAFIVDVQVPKGQLTPMFIELALYDAAAHIARQHALVETMRNIKREAWT